MSSCHNKSEMSIISTKLKDLNNHDSFPISQAHPNIYIYNLAPTNYRLDKSIKVFIIQPKTIRYKKNGGMRDHRL